MIRLPQISAHEHHKHGGIRCCCGEQFSSPCVRQEPNAAREKHGKPSNHPETCCRSSLEVQSYNGTHQHDSRCEDIQNCDCSADVSIPEVPDVLSWIWTRLSPHWPVLAEPPGEKVLVRQSTKRCQVFPGKAVFIL